MADRNATAAGGTVPGASVGSVAGPTAAPAASEGAVGPARAPADGAAADSGAADDVSGEAARWRGLAEEIQGLADEAIQRHEAPGVVVQVSHRGDVVLRGAYGCRSVEPTVETMTLFRARLAASVAQPARLYRHFALPRGGSARADQCECRAWHAPALRTDGSTLAGWSERGL